MFTNNFSALVQEALALGLVQSSDAMRLVHELTSRMLKKKYFKNPFKGPGLVWVLVGSCKRLLQICRV